MNSLFFAVQAPLGPGRPGSLLTEPSSSPASPTSKLCSSCESVRTNRKFPHDWRSLLSWDSASTESWSACASSP